MFGFFVLSCAFNLLKLATFSKRHEIYVSRKSAKFSKHRTERACLAFFSNVGVFSPYLITSIALHNIYVFRKRRPEDAASCLVLMISDQLNLSKGVALETTPDQWT